MDKKITLSLNQQLLDKAKEYAPKNDISLSKIIESYLQTLTSKTDEEDEIEISPLVASLCGVGKLPEDFDYKKYGINRLGKKNA